MAASGDQQATETTKTDRLRILHVMRAPVGGLFRHVVDLARAQSLAGHDVGIVADNGTGGDTADRVFADLRPFLSLGLTRMPMQRWPHPADVGVAWRVSQLARAIAPHVLHGHGAKGGLYVRLPAVAPGFPKPARPPVRAYTPHGGSLHFSPSSVTGWLFLRAEGALERATDLIVFESGFARRRFVDMVRAPHGLSPIVHNGLAPAEFAPLTPTAEAADFVFVGEMRWHKGVDLLIAALDRLGDDSRLALVGSGPDEAAFRALAARLDVAHRISFHPPEPSREAMRRGRILVAPSRAESLPYVVLEAIAARVPVVACDVGGLSEIYGGEAHRLAPADNAEALAQAMRAMQDMTPAAREALTAEMARAVGAHFTIDRMTDGVLCAYRDAIRAQTQTPMPSAQLQTGD